MYMYLYKTNMGAHRGDAEHFIAYSKTIFFRKQRDSVLEMSVTVSAHSQDQPVFSFHHIFLFTHLKRCIVALILLQ